MGQGAECHEGLFLFCHALRCWRFTKFVRMQGYLNNPEATANSITKTGWFKTGDVAVIDEDGYYSIVDRMKELIKYKVRLLVLYAHSD